MKRRLSLGQILVCSMMLMSFTSCQEEEFYKKDSYETFEDIYEKNLPNEEGPDVPSVIAEEDDFESNGDSSNPTPGTGGTGGTGDDTVADNGGSDQNDDDQNDGGNTGGGDDDDDTIVDNGGGNDGGDNGGNDDEEDEPSYVAKSESFTQNATQSKKMDILWVVDNSGSMADEQANLANNFDVFIKDFITKDVDFQMAITTTDVSSSYRAGRPVDGSIAELTDEKAKANKTRFLRKFKEMIQVGTSGSSTEQGLQATNSFASNHGRSFFRDDAYLVIIIVSDENDSSPKTVAQHMNFLMGYKGQSSLVKTYSIVDMSGAPKSSQWHAPGYDRYAQATQISGGTVSSIHSNFATTLGQIGSSMAQLASSFPLVGTPVDGSIEVFVGGVKQTTGWNYDSASRSISFAQGFIPTAGSAIEVKYQQLVQ